MPDNAQASPYPYNLPRSRAGCTDTFTVYTANYESTGLIQAMKLHMETVHSTMATSPARTEKAYILKIDKGLQEMLREELTANEPLNQDYQVRFCPKLEELMKN